MTKSSGKKKDPMPFLALWPGYGLLHYVLLFVVSLVLGQAAPAVPKALALVAMGAEKILRATTDYHGQPAIRSTLIIANSLAYGLAAAIVHVIVRRRARAA